MPGERLFETTRARARTLMFVKRSDERRQGVLDKLCLIMKLGPTPL